MNKYHARSVDYDGYHFDSQKEYVRYQELKLLQKAGEIIDIAVHPEFILLDKFTYRGQVIQGIKYSPDFMYTECNGETKVIEEVKGGKATRTRDFELRRKLFLHKYPDFDYRII